MKKGVKLKGLLDCFSVYASSHVSICGFDPHVRVLTVLAAVETRNHGAMATLAITTHLISSHIGQGGGIFGDAPVCSRSRTGSCFPFSRQI